MTMREMGARRTTATKKGDAHLSFETGDYLITVSEGGECFSRITFYNELTASEREATMK